MTIVECLKTRPYICTNGIYADECDYPYNPYISAGDYAYIFATKLYTEYGFMCYQIIASTNNYACVYILKKNEFESCFKMLSDDDLVIKDVLE